MKKNLDITKHRYTCYNEQISPEQTAMENAINVSLLSMFLQRLKSSFSRWPSCYAQWEVHSEQLEKHLSLV